MNSYASTIQAASSVLSVIVTAVLVGITVRYVALTRTLAEAASAQLRGQAEATAARSRGLQSEITLLITLLDSLPGSSEQGMADKLLRERTIEWGDFDFRLFRMAASEVSLEAGQRASVVEARMKWLGERVRSIKSVDPRSGFDWSNFDWRASGTTLCSTCVSHFEGSSGGWADPVRHARGDIHTRRRACGNDVW